MIATQIEVKPNKETQLGKTENHIDFHIRKLISIFDEHREPNAKKWKLR